MTFPIPTMNHLSGKAAVFVRGAILHLDSQISQTDVPLRPTQKAGMDAVEALGDTISVAYLSKLTKLLEESGVVSKMRKGKGYVLNRATRYHELAEYIAASEWGMSIQKEASEDDIRMRSAIIDHMTDVGSVRIEAEHPIDKRAYQVLIDKFKAGQYDMVFVQRDDDLVNQTDGYRVRTLNESVANG